MVIGEKCNAVIADPDCAADAIERMAACLLAAVCQPKAVACVKGRFFHRAHEKLTQLAKFATNELVPVDMRNVSALLAAEVRSDDCTNLPLVRSPGSAAASHPRASGYPASSGRRP